MKRREFISLVDGAAAWPIAARAQQPEKVRRIGMLIGFDDPERKVFQQELERLGWSEGRNLHIDYRYAPAGAEARIRAKELVVLQPEVIFAQSRPITAALQETTRTIPIVFTFVVDPIGAGFVPNLTRPNGNMTGFMMYESSVAGTWLEMLKEIAPKTTRVAVLGNPKTAAYYDYLLQAAEVAAPSLGIEAVPAQIENAAADIERAIAVVAAASNSGMISLLDSTTAVNRELIIVLAARYRLPTVYSGRSLSPTEV